MANLGKILIIFGLFLAVVGGFLILFPKTHFFGKLPGDIYIKKGNFSFYFPVVTCIIISLILTIIFSIFFRK